VDAVVRNVTGIGLTLCACACGNVRVEQAPYPQALGDAKFGDVGDAADAPVSATPTDAEPDVRVTDGDLVPDVEPEVGDTDTSADTGPGTGWDGNEACATDADCKLMPQPKSACQTIACEAGKCVPKALPDGHACGEGACTTLQGVPVFEGKVCVFGTCNDTTTQLSCLDGAPCTIDGCDEKTGCSHAVNDKACDDNNPCTAEVCSAGSGCLYSATAVPCDDGDACTDGDTCSGGQCAGKAAAVCACKDDGDCKAKNPCSKGTCKDGTCAFAANPGAVCNDGDACTKEDACLETGACGGKPVTCDDGIDCTLDACDKLTGCLSLPNPLACDDGNACTVNTCAASTTGGKADAKGCTTKPAADQPCNDANACTEGDACKGGVCKAGAAKVCESPSACQVTACETATGICSAAPAKDGSACDDGNPCSAKDGCKDGVCQGEQNPCDDTNPCTFDGCEAGGKCKLVPQQGPCDADGNKCTDSDQCSDGKCTPGPAKVCDDKNPCTSDTCDPKLGCAFKAVATGVPCGLDLYCVTGKCAKVVVPAGMGYVAAADYAQGCNAAVDQLCKADEKPAHEVAVASFFVDKTEVTAAQYGKCVDAGACTEPGGIGQSDATFGVKGKEAMPVNFVQWSQAGTYCAWAGGGRLCSEAEWELAARGKDGRRYPWGNAAPTCALANYSGCLPKGPHAVGQSAQGQSPYALHDMAGNVREWVADWYAAGYYATVAPKAQNPPGPATGSQRVMRGGWFGDAAPELRTSARAFAPPTTQAASVGFRCCRSPK
jgi:formylglycine-generating enzyme required for sulfatase activity